ncbi:MAG: hypothetical protein VZR54_04690 [Ruminococcus sp.]|nr:hypothetical protein [Ruminococcus sp.]
MGKSNNKYDWLGSGIYFWENSYERAYNWALEQSKRDNAKIKNPAVIGAVIDLGHCLNLTDYGSKKVLKKGYEMLKMKLSILGKQMPENRNVGKNTDLLLRDLDCAVIQEIHSIQKFLNQTEDEPLYDSVRGVFIEGGEVYPNSGFREKTHIQICVVNPNCIKGYFKPREIDKNYIIP